MCQFIIGLWILSCLMLTHPRLSSTIIILIIYEMHVSVHWTHRGLFVAHTVSQRWVASFSVDSGREKSFHPNPSESHGVGDKRSWWVCATAQNATAFKRHMPLWLPCHWPKQDRYPVQKTMGQESIILFQHGVANILSNETMYFMKKLRHCTVKVPWSHGQILTEASWVHNLCF